MKKGVGWVEVVNCLLKGKCESLTLIETKMKVNEEISSCGVSGICAGIQENELDKESVAYLLKESVCCRIVWP